MKLYKVSAGTKGVLRDLSKFCSFAPLVVDFDRLFKEEELSGIEDNRYEFKSGLNLYFVPVNQVVVLHG